MEDKETFPAEGLDHFESYFKNIRESNSTRTNVWWGCIDHFGSELSQSLKQKKVSKKEVEEFRQQIGAFMNEENNREDYREKLESSGETPSFWWEKEEAKKGK